MFILVFVFPEKPDFLPAVVTRALQCADPFLTVPSLPALRSRCDLTILESTRKRGDARRPGSSCAARRWRRGPPAGGRAACSAGWCGAHSGRSRSSRRRLSCQKGNFQTPLHVRKKKKRIVFCTSKYLCSPDVSWRPPCPSELCKVCADLQQSHSPRKSNPGPRLPRRGSPARAASQPRQQRELVRTVASQTPAASAQGAVLGGHGTVGKRSFRGRDGV